MIIYQCVGVDIVGRNAICHVIHKIPQPVYIMRIKQYCVAFHNVIIYQCVGVDIVDGNYSEL